jgi:hypothetical protein
MKFAYLMFALSISTVLLYFNSMYNLTEIPGNPIKILLVFAIAETIGIGVADKFVNLIKDSNQVALNLTLVLILNFVVKFVEMSENLMLFCFLAEIFCIGIVFNLWIIIMQRRVEFEL